MPRLAVVVVVEESLSIKETRPPFLQSKKNGILSLSSSSQHFHITSLFHSPHSPLTPHRTQQHATLSLTLHTLTPFPPGLTHPQPMPSHSQHYHSNQTLAPYFNLLALPCPPSSNTRLLLLTPSLPAFTPHHRVVTGTHPHASIQELFAALLPSTPRDITPSPPPYHQHHPFSFSILLARFPHFLSPPFLPSSSSPSCLPACPTPLSRQNHLAGQRSGCSGMCS